MTTEKLDPCPFCGATSLSIVFAALSARVTCLQCQATGPELHQQQTMEQAAVVWNQRDTKVVV